MWETSLWLSRFFHEWNITVSSLIMISSHRGLSVSLTATLQIIQEQWFLDAYMEKSFSLHQLRELVETLWRMRTFLSPEVALLQIPVEVRMLHLIRQRHVSKSTCAMIPWMKLSIIYLKECDLIYGFPCLFKLLCMGGPLQFPCDVIRVLCWLLREDQETVNGITTCLF